MKQAINTHIALCLLSFSSWCIALDDEFYYQLGGGLPISMGPGGTVNTTTVEAGIAWNANLMCGDFDLELSIRNQLEGITGYYKNLMNELVGAVTGAIASLPALALQRANPALYDMFQNGVLQAKGEFRAAELSCESIVDSMNTTITNNGWAGLAEGNYWASLFSGETQDIVAASAPTLVRASVMGRRSSTAGNTDLDILDTEKRAEEDSGNAGVPWVGGEHRGGAGQQPLQLNRNTAVAGYNLLFARAAANPNPVSAIACDQASLCEIWPRPAAAADWIIDVLGEMLIRTCTGCQSVETQAGMGLHKHFEREKNRIDEALRELVNPATVLDQTALASIGGGEGMHLTRPLIEAIREEQAQTGLIDRIAGELAISRTMEQALLARRVLLAGIREPNIANNKLALDELRRTIDELETEIEHMVFEIEIRQKMVSATALMLLRRSTERNRIPLSETAAPQTISEGASQ